MADANDHYLKRELYELIQKDPTVFDFLQQCSLDGLWYRDLEATENEWVNPAFWQLLGYDPAQKRHLASDWQELIHPDDLKSVITNLDAHRNDPKHPFDQIVRYRHKNGSTVWVRCRGAAIRNASGKPVRMLGSYIDLSELKATEVALTRRTAELERAHEKLKEFATRDSLTALYNRRMFQEHFEWLIQDSRRRSESTSILLIDLDHFKQINDTFGHSKGDAVLTKVASVLKRTARRNDFPARYGGEEFAIALPGTGETGSLVAGERIRASIEAIDQVSVRITASIGIATFIPEEYRPEVSQVFTELIDQADRALYAAKSKNRNHVCHFKSLR